jgi:hypothetical protein
VSKTAFTDGKRAAKCDFNAAELSLFRNVQPARAVRC